MSYVGKRQFKSWQDYRRFQMSVRRTNRYFRTREAAVFLKTVLETSERFHQTWEAGSRLWRAQLGHDWRLEELDEGESFRVPCPHPPGRMLPLRDAASEGRANPKGIPYLYLATDKDTALAEVRPWLGSLVSLGSFEVLEDLKIANFASHEQRNIVYFEEPPPEERALAVWADIDEAFSRPVGASETTADYAPTQIIAEMFKNTGFEGIAYRSALGKGLNVALFDFDVVRLVACSLFEAESLRFAFRESANPYFVRRESTEP